MHQTRYQIAAKADSRKLTEFLCQEGQFLLPMVELEKSVGTGAGRGEL
jgi:hypothetical protein